jgi:hypothetical protein
MPRGPSPNSIRTRLFQLFHDNPGVRIDDDRLLAEFPGKKLGTIRVQISRLRQSDTAFEVHGQRVPLDIRRDRATGEYFSVNAGEETVPPPPPPDPPPVGSRIAFVLPDGKTELTGEVRGVEIERLIVKIDGSDERRVVNGAAGWRTVP